MKHVPYPKLKEVALLCGGVALLVAFALVLSGHVPFVPRALSVIVHQNVQSQTAAVWASYYPSYDGGWPLPHASQPYGGWCNAHFQTCPLPSYASVYVNSNPGWIELARVSLPGFYFSFLPYDGPTYSGSIPTIPAGTPVTVEWACQDYQSVTISGGQCQSYDAFGNCSNYTSSGGYVNPSYDYGPAVVNGVSRSNVGAMTVYPTQTTTYSVYCPASGWQIQTTTHASIPTTPTMYMTVNVTAPPPPTLTLTANPSTINPGQNTYLTWNAAGGSGIDSCLLGGGQFGGGVPVGLSGTTGAISPNPSTQYWYDCHDPYNSWAPPAFTTVNVASLAPVQADFAPASPTVMVGQSATLLYYAQSANPPTACHINGTGNIGTLLDVPTCTIAENKSYTTPVYTTPGTYDYYFYYYRNSWVYVKPAYVTVVAACPNGSGSTGACTACNSGYTLSGGSCVLTPTDICTDINGSQLSTPTGCKVPVPNPGSCIPSGYTYNGSACVTAPPSIGTFSVSPTRIHKNIPTNVTFSYLINNPPASCTISGPIGFTPLTINPVSAVVGTRTASVTLQQASNFTLTCGAVSAQTRINLIPVTQEL